MSKKEEKKGGFWDNFINRPFGGMFDLNGDGREDLGEQWIAHKTLKLFEDSDEDDEEDTGSHNYYSTASYSNHYSTVSYSDSRASRDYRWREFCEDGSEYGVDPEDYETEEEYEEALEEAKYAWREDAEDGSEYDVDPEDYETEEEYMEALEEAKYAWREDAEDGSDYGVDPEEALQKQQKLDFLEDKTIYTYCGVMLPFSDRPYSYRTDDDGLEIGDEVVVPVGEEDKEMNGIIVSIGRYASIGVPFPVEKTKFIIRKVPAE